jgi:hypothetical protein
MVSSLVSEHIVKPGNFGSRSGYQRSAFTDRTPQLNPSYMLRLLLIGFTLPSIFNLRIILNRCCTGLMMCSIHIDEYAIDVSITARSSRLCVPFSEKLDSLLDRLDNWRTMHGYRYNALEWARENQNEAQYYSVATLHML